MSYRPLTAVLPRVILFAGILLAVSMLAIPLYNSAFAQDDGNNRIPGEREDCGGDLHC